MEYYDMDFYKNELDKIIKDKKDFLRNKSIVITGARGMIGSMLIDAVMLVNQKYQMNCKIYAVVRNVLAAEKRFKKYINDPLFFMIVADINKNKIELQGDVDYVIHGASNTHPLLYAGKPIETILTNTVGTNNLLEFSVKCNCKRFLFLSSVEIYGENRGDCEKYREDYCGYIDSNTLRAGYPEGKRVGETLCQAYRKEYGMKCIILRIARCYGPGLLEGDSKALTQFLCRAKKGQDIILKSEGKQYYSYIYQADVVDAIFHFMQYGEDGESYNITGKNSNITLRELALEIAKILNVSVKYELPDREEAIGYSKTTKALLDGCKAENVGWMPSYSIKEGIERSLC